MVNQLISLKLPENIGRLGELAYNLWWSWNKDARTIFRNLSYSLWQISGHNPVKLLLDISPERLREAAGDQAFLDLYRNVMAIFDHDMAKENSSFAAGYQPGLSGPIAYFSPEFAIHSSLPVYAGGLGILAGDICKEASDFGLPLVGVGLMYPQGYFHQIISDAGWQEEVFRQLDFGKVPVNPVVSPQGSRNLVSVELDNHIVQLGAWLIRIGRVSLYLLDTNIEDNSPQYRELSARLYAADRETRIQQEIVLGIGGVRVMRALGIKPVLWHANEGHTAFMMLERIREEVQKGQPFPEAMRSVKAASIFTTHTPVPAGHDTFSPELMDKYFGRYWGGLGIGRQEFLELGQHAGETTVFNMTTLALKMAEHCHGVSKIHGRVARKMWQVLYPGLPEERVPINQITNGVHVFSWIAPEIGNLYDQYLGAQSLHNQNHPDFLRKVNDIPDEELWRVHKQLKSKLMAKITEQARKRWAVDGISARNVLAIGALLDTEALTICFARRFTEYKRPALIFRDIERLKRIINNRRYPVQIIIAGKSHPADGASKNLLHQVFTLATDRAFMGRIAFVEDYDMHVAHYLVQGVDVWLNNPRRPLEACGTSGMKAAFNGVLNFSVRDGWWDEAYNGINGWAIGQGAHPGNNDEEDNIDAQDIYRILETEIIPLYYDQDWKGVPHGWAQRIKASIGSILPAFSARRMLQEYTEQLYLPAARLAAKPSIGAPQ